MAHLIKTVTGRKNGKYLYQVIDSDGKVISERRSNRDYVACTIHGNFYFGRIDLINKGEHRRMEELLRSRGEPGYEIAYLKKD